MRYKPARIRININFRRIFDKRMRDILNNKDIVMPIFKALDLNAGLSRDLVSDAKAIALSPDSSNSKIINIGKSVRISDQLSTWSSIGIKEFIAAESINYYSQSL